MYAQFVPWLKQPYVRFVLPPDAQSGKFIYKKFFQACSNTHQLMGALQKDAFSAENALNVFMQKCNEEGIEEECRELLEPVFSLLRLVYRDTSHV